jgi:hypothetical protein
VSVIDILIVDGMALECIANAVLDGLASRDLMIKIPGKPSQDI